MKFVHLNSCVYFLNLVVQVVSSNFDLLLPTLQVALLVHPHNKLNVLPFTLTSLQNQDYPKNRIQIDIYFDLYTSIANNVWSHSSVNAHKNAQTLQALKMWANELRNEYKEINLNIEHLTTLFEDSQKELEFNESTDYWTENRFEKIIRLRNLALNRAKQNWADFILYLDADVVLTNQSALTTLIKHNQEHQVFGPMLTSLDTYSNFWAAMSEDGYYERSERYFTILYKEELGSHVVPMIHSCFLINLNCVPCQKLTFNASTIPNSPLDDVIAFGLIGRSTNIEFRVDNRISYGFVMPTIDREDSIQSEQQLLDLQLQHLYQNGESLSISPLLESFFSTRRFALPIPTIDHVYVVNLKRRSDRRKRMQIALNLLGIQGEIWQAVDGRQLTKDFLVHQNITPLPNYLDPFHQRPMTFGEIGCFLSHYQIWQDALENSYSRVLILEDDVRFASEFLFKLNQVLDSVQNVPFDLLYLGRKQQDRNQIELAVSLWTVRPSYSYWTIGYILTNSGLQKLIDSRPLDRMIPIDEYLPIMYNQHPNHEWSAHFTKRNLLALATKPTLIEPLFYIGEANYVSDTEESLPIVKEEQESSHFEL